MTSDSTNPSWNELLEHQDFVRRLARHLVGDEHRADDLVQDVWMTALRKKPAAVVSMRAWLSRVTRNHAAKVVRGDERRRTRETLVAGSISEQASEDFEAEFELQRLISETVHKLDEPYRRTLLLRYFKELSHTDIATKTGVPVATVRTRLQRALSLVREELDRKHGGERLTWENGLVAFMGGSSAVGSSIVFSGVLMGLLAKVGLGLAVAFGVVLMVSGPDLEEPMSLAESPEPGSSQQLENLKLVAMELESEPLVAKRELQVPPKRHSNLDVIAETALTSRIRIMSAETGKPVPGALVELWTRPAETLPQASMAFVLGDLHNGVIKFGSARRYQSDSEGYALIPVLPLAGLVRATMDAEVGFLQLAGIVEESTDLVIVLPTSLLIRVKDTMGNRRRGAKVMLSGFAGAGYLTADEQGEIQLENAGGLLAQLTEFFDLDAPRPEYAAGGYPGPLGHVGSAVLASSHATVFTADMPREVELITRPTGLVRVELRDLTGKPITLGYPYIAFKLELDGVSWEHNYFEFNAGSQLDSWLPSGATFKAAFTSGMDSDSAVHFEGVVPGPLDPAFVFPVEIDGLPPVTLKARLVDEKREPLAHFAFSLEQRVEPGFHALPFVLMTDGRGEFSLSMNAKMVHGFSRLGSKLTLTFVDESGELPARAEVVVVRADFVIEELIDLGDITFGPPDHSPPNLVVAGKTVDGYGAPLGGVGLTLASSSPIEGHPTFRTLTALENRKRWVSDEDGKFRIEGFAASGELHLFAEKEGWLQGWPLDCEAGSADVAVPLEAAGSIAGSFELEAEVAVIDYCIILRPSNANARPLPNPMNGFNTMMLSTEVEVPVDWSSIHFPNKQGEWSFEDLADGLYDIRIAEGDSTPFGRPGLELLLVESIRVQAGEVTVDARLTKLRLSTLVK